MTWTEKTRQSETWTAIGIETLPRVFSRDVFSFKFVGGLRVFATGPSAGLWDERSEQSEAWTVVI